MKDSLNESLNTREIRELISRIHDSTNAKDSIYEQAEIYFQQLKGTNEKQLELQADNAGLQKKISKPARKDKEALLKKQLHSESNTKKFSKELEEQRITRYNSLKQICEMILKLSEGDNLEETNKKSARLLCTIQLTTPTEGSLVAKSHAKAKHLYMAVLCLRLLDRMLLDGNITNKYILDVVRKGERGISSMSTANEGNSAFRQELQIPLLMAALLLDVGSCHPDAKKILNGEDGSEDPHRVLSHEEHSQLMTISFNESIAYFTAGIGMGIYVGNSREKRDRFNEIEKNKFQFIKALLNNWISPHKGIGNLLKITHIYTSLLMSTKPNYDYRLLPLAFDLLRKKADEGIYNKVTVDSLLKITGKFPPGFGITYIPKDSEGRACDRYEYAIVTGLYPEDFSIPICRLATKSLIFVSHGIDGNIGSLNNLYYPETRKKLEKIGKARLQEIEEKLSSNFKEKREQDYIPRCWHPGEFFSNKKNQNLWNTSTHINIS